MFLPSPKPSRDHGSYLLFEAWLRCGGTCKGPSPVPSSSFENLRTISRLGSHLEVHRVVEVRVGKETLKPIFKLSIFSFFFFYLIVDEDLDQKQGWGNINQADFPSFVVDIGVPHLCKELVSRKYFHCCHHHHVGRC